MQRNQDSKYKAVHTSGKEAHCDLTTDDAAFASSRMKPERSIFPKERCSWRLEWKKLYTEQKAQIQCSPHLKVALVWSSQPFSKNSQEFQRLRVLNCPSRANIGLEDSFVAKFSNILETITTLFRRLTSRLSKYRTASRPVTGKAVPCDR